MSMIEMPDGSVWFELPNIVIDPKTKRQWSAHLQKSKEQKAALLRAGGKQVSQPPAN